MSSQKDDIYSNTVGRGRKGSTCREVQHWALFYCVCDRSAWLRREVCLHTCSLPQGLSPTSLVAPLVWVTHQTSAMAPEGRAHDHAQGHDAQHQLGVVDHHCARRRHRLL